MWMSTNVPAVMTTPTSITTMTMKDAVMITITTMIMSIITTTASATATTIITNTDSLAH